MHPPPLAQYHFEHIGRSSKRSIITNYTIIRPLHEEPESQTSHRGQGIDLQRITKREQVARTTTNKVRPIFYWEKIIFVPHGLIFYSPMGHFTFWHAHVHWSIFFVPWQCIILMIYMRWWFWSNVICYVLSLIWCIMDGFLFLYAMQWFYLMMAWCLCDEYAMWWCMDAFIYFSTFSYTFLMMYANYLWCTNA